MRIYPNEITMRMPSVHLLQMYNTGMFKDGLRKHNYDQRFVNLLLLELVGLDDIENGTPINDITMKFISSKCELRNKSEIAAMYLCSTNLTPFFFIVVYKNRVGCDKDRLKKLDTYIKNYVKQQKN